MEDYVNCTQDYFQNGDEDQALFKATYLVEQQARLKWLQDEDPELEIHDEDNHPAMSTVFNLHELFVKNIAGRLDEINRGNLGAVCKKWGKMFVLGVVGPEWEKAYVKKLEFHHGNGVSIVKRSGILVAKYCLCKFIVGDVKKQLFNLHQQLYELEMQSYAVVGHGG